MTSNNEPRNINEARRLIRTQEKAFKLRSEGYEFDLTDYDAGDNTGIVDVFKPGQTSLLPSYKIMVNAPYFTGTTTTVCDCPDFGKHKDYCKHTLAVNDLLQENAMVAEYEASQQELRESIGDWFVD